MSPVKITLYSTDGCHLCELAQAQLLRLDIAFMTRDIIDDAELVTRYGTTIPVIARADGAELNWPFDIGQLEKFLEE